MRTNNFALGNIDEILCLRAPRVGGGPGDWDEHDPWVGGHDGLQQVAGQVSHA